LEGVADADRERLARQCCDRAVVAAAAVAEPVALAIEADERHQEAVGRDRGSATAGTGMPR
jgi:hypothetical protein